MALELVANRDTREPFDVTEQLAARVKAQAFERGLLVYPGSGTIDGRRGDHILLAPPYTVSSAELEVIVDRLGQSIEAATAGKKPS
jgi:adenosylmethionine-8-amino-7-oxononanoate aminotransferase